MVELTMRARFLFLFLASLQFAGIVPADAQRFPGGQFVSIRVYVSNKKDGSPIPGAVVGYSEEGSDCRVGTSGPSRFRTFATTGLDGVAQFRIPTCVGTSTVWLEGPGAFETRSGKNFETTADMFEIIRGQTAYSIRLRADPAFETPESDRVLHIRVQGKKGSQLLPVHYATIYDVQGNKLATTGYDGRATVRHHEALGETVVLRAVPSAMPGNDESWEPASSSFIVGAAESSLRTTRAEDYVNIVLGGNNSNSEKHPLDILVRGRKLNSPNSCRCQRIVGARILDSSGHVLAVTDSAGRATATVDVPLGETYVVKAEATHWKSASERLQSGASTSIGTVAHESVEFMLEPAEEHGALTVEVLDRESNKPVHGADVILYKPEHYPGTVVGHEETNGQGEAVFSAQDVDEALLNGEARVEAKHGGWESSTQTVSESLIKGDSPRYLIYIKESTEKTNWSGTWYEGPYTMHVSGGTGSLGYTALRSQGVGTCCPLVDQGSGSCTVKGNVASCKWSSVYNDIPPTHDGGKIVQRGGHGTLTFVRGRTPADDYISYKFHQDTGTITLGAGTCPDINQCTGMHPGAEWSGTWTRKKP
jgi:5-hydroxyisourate hydrolase-like protein (transthyretin family)